MSQGKLLMTRLELRLWNELTLLKGNTPTHFAIQNVITKPTIRNVKKLIREIREQAKDEANRETLENVIGKNALRYVTLLNVKAMRKEVEK